MPDMSHEKVYAMPFAKIYPLYVSKVRKKGRTQAELDQVLCWLTGYSQPQLDAQIDADQNHLGPGFANQVNHGLEVSARVGDLGLADVVQQ